MATLEREWRILRVPAPELRSADGEPTVLEGYGIVFNSYSRNLGGFVEEVDPESVVDTLAQQGRDIVGLVNHDPNWLLASTASRTMELVRDDTGVQYRMLLDESDPDALRAMAKVRSGKMRGSSFSFRALQDDWSTTEQGFPLRKLRSIEIYDMGPVTMAAYPKTEGDGMAVALRSLADHVGAPLERIVSAAAENRLAEFLGGPQPDPARETPSRPALSKWASRFGVHVAGS